MITLNLDEDEHTFKAVHDAVAKEVRVLEDCYERSGGQLPRRDENSLKALQVLLRDIEAEIEVWAERKRTTWRW